MKHRLTILSRNGHDVAEWDIADAESVKVAETEFNRLKHQGYSAFAEFAVGDPVQLYRFDENVETILMVPQIAGGTH